MLWTVLYPNIINPQTFLSQLSHSLSSGSQSCPEVSVQWDVSIMGLAGADREVSF